MNRYYIVVPIVLMAVFVYFERDSARGTELKEKQKIEAESKKKDEEAAKKRQLEEKAKIDAEKRNEQRIADEKDKDKKKKDEYDAKIQKMKDDLKKYTDDVELNTRLVTKLEKDLAEKRELRERENRAVFEFAKKVEISKKMRRDAELEVQRYNEMLARRASESVMANPPANLISAK
jgi:preprotein translocase subunit SecF